MDQVFSDNKVIISKTGAVGHILLNRPQALNALDLDMVREISFALRGWEKDDEIKAVFIEGAGERAFCAGGDIKGFYMAGMDYRKGNISMEVAFLFFEEEYALNRQIFHFSKPIIAYMDGITMGGGFGIGGHARYRVISGRTVFAMPETRIGFFPDIGSMYYLSRMKDGVGAHLALTGNSIDAPSMIYAGLAGYLVAPEQKEALVSALSKALAGGGDVDQAIASVLAPYAQNPDQACDLATKAQVFSKYYRGQSLDALFAGISGASEDAIKADYAVIAKNSPVSVVVTYDYLQRARDLDFDAVMDIDLALARCFMQGRDFYEGIRAAVIDKDRNPVWENDVFDDALYKVGEGYFSA